MAQIVTLGSATQDIFLLRPSHEHIKRYVTDHHELVMVEGTKISVEGIHYAPGGGAINAAIALHTLGNEVTPWCMVGHDAAGDFIVADLTRRRITTEAIVRSSEHGTGVTCIITCDSCDALLLVYRGANSYADRSFRCAHDCVQPDSAKKMYTTPYWYCGPLSGEPAQHFASLLQYVRPYVKAIAVNPSAFQLGAGFAHFAEALPYIDILTCNAREARILAESLGPNLKLQTQLVSSREDMFELPPLLGHFYKKYSLVDVAQALLTHGPQVMMVTDGSHGAYVIDREQAYFHSAPPLAPVSTVGAGDAFGATFFSYLIAGETIASALVRGVINSAAVLQYVDAQTGLLSSEELQLRYERYGTSAVQVFRYTL
jgi:ribokinase